MFVIRVVDNDENVSPQFWGPYKRRDAAIDVADEIENNSDRLAAYVEQVSTPERVDNHSDAEWIIEAMR